MVSFIAGAAAAFLLLTGAFLFWQSHAEQGPSLPTPPEARSAGALPYMDNRGLHAPEASPQSREEKRFSRADKNKDGKIESDEVFSSRRKAFAKLDANGNGSLSFDEWAAKTIAKFQGADRDHTGWLTPAEYATTAPPLPKHKTCSCSG
jgi:hypothetical protein